MPLTTAVLYLTTQLLITGANLIDIPSYGSVQGELNDDGVLQYMKIPFAAPPINDLRWAPPQPADPWNSVLDAGIQDVPACLSGYSSGAESEDCLYLSIWAPSDAEKDNTNYAVMIYLHGGSFDKGENDADINSPSNLVKNIDDVIVVIPNYRLGLLGFMYDNAYNTGVIGNYGIQDQTLAIQWVYDNIDNFGGDPQQITLFGFSSGATSVAIHLTNSNPYIKGGIMMSPPFHIPLRSPTTWFDVSQNFHDLTGCVSTTNTSDGNEVLNCWRSVPATDIITMQTAQSTYGIPGVTTPGKFVINWAYGNCWSPTKNTALIAEEPVYAWQNPVETAPFIIGHTKDEIWYWITETLEMYKGVMDYPFLSYFLFLVFGDPTVVGQILYTYGISDNTTYSGEYLYDYAAILNDNWICAIRNIVANAKSAKKWTKRRVTRACPGNNYYYSFDVEDEEQFRQIFSSKHANCYTKTCHETDLYYLLQQPAYQNDYTDDAKAIGATMQELWTNFAKKLNPNPNPKANNVWPKYDHENGVNYLQILDGDQFNKESIANDDTHFCAFWDQIGYSGEYHAISTSAHEVIEEENNEFGSDVYMKNRFSFVTTVVLLVIVAMSVMLNGIFAVRYCVKKEEKQKFKVIANINMDEEEEAETDDEAREAMIAV